MPSQLVYVPPVTGPFGERTFPQISLNTGNTAGTVALEAHCTVLVAFSGPPRAIPLNAEL